MKFVFYIAAFLFALVACKKPEGCVDPNAINYDINAIIDDGSCQYECEGCGLPGLLSGTITSNTVLGFGEMYTLSGRVVVASGVTLTIEPGVIIKGAEGTGSLASMLIIEKGAKINACGTASHPIIFTSILDNIQPGEYSGTNLGQNDRGLWGGIVLAGAAPVSTADADTLGVIEGIPWLDNYGTFGGNASGDNSGNICYVSIRHAGALIGAGNELGSLTLAGVGNGTQISNVEIIAGLDDGLDVIGGTVDVSNIFIGFMGDDGIDLDQNYDGTVSNFTIFDGDGDAAIESEGPEGSTHTGGSFHLLNGTVTNFGGSNSKSSFKTNAQGSVNNVNFNGVLRFETAYNANCTQLEASCLKRLLDSPATLEFNNINRTQLEYQIVSQNGCTLSPSHQSAAENATANASPTGNSNSDWNWTWLYTNGFL